LERDEEARAKGVGHRAVIATKNDRKVSALTASYGRGVRLDESVIKSPCGHWVWLMSAKEHAVIKDLPSGLVNGLSKTAAYRVLDNSVDRHSWALWGKF